MTTVFVAVLLIVAAACVAVFIVQPLRRRRILDWLPGYLAGVLKRRKADGAPVHVMFCFVDHFEPRWGQAPTTTPNARGCDAGARTIRASAPLTATPTAGRPDTRSSIPKRSIAPST